MKKIILALVMATAFLSTTAMADTKTLIVKPGNNSQVCQMDGHTTIIVTSYGLNTPNTSHLCGWVIVYLSSDKYRTTTEVRNHIINKGEKYHFNSLFSDIAYTCDKNREILGVIHSEQSIILR